MKKIISLILALIMIMSVAVVGFSAMAADDDAAVVEVTGEESTEDTTEEHRNFYQVIWDMILEVYGLFKYIFYDVFLGKAP